MTALPNIPPPFTVRSLADYWGCSEGAVRKRLNDGDLRSFRIGALIRIPVSEVERFEQCQITPSNDLGRDGPLSGETGRASAGVSSLPRLTDRAPRPKLVSDGGSHKEARAPWEE